MPIPRRYYADGPEPLIVSLASKGDRDAFEELVRRRQGWIRAFMRRFCGDTSLADDLSQQVFMQAWRKIVQLREPNRFGAWLKRLAINEWLQYSRKSDAMLRAQNDDDVESKHYDATSMAIDLDAAIATLPAPVALCVVLSYYERLTHDEISDLTDIKSGTVKSHVRRGSERLRKLLAVYDSTASEDTA